MDDASRLSLIVVVLLILCAAYFAVAETSFASVSRVRIKVRAERGEAKAIRALKVLDNFDLAITSILICTNIVHLSAASIATLAVTRMFPGVSGAVTISTFVMTLVVFFAGEMLPKSIAKKYSERLSLSVAGSLWFFMTILKPLAQLLADSEAVFTCLNKNVLLLGPEQFRQLGEGKVLFNTSIGPGFDPDALQDWLTLPGTHFFCDTRAAAGPVAEGFFERENVHCANVSAGRTKQAFVLLSRKVLDNIRTALGE